MNKESIEEQIINQLMDNSLCFLEKAKIEVEGEEKYTYIYLWSAIELFLKARVCCEHWTLVVKGEPNLEHLFSGNFNSKNFQNLCCVIKNVCQDNSVDCFIEQLDVIRKRRNKWLHFHYTPSKKKEILLIDSLIIFYFIYSQTIGPWKEHFAAWSQKVKSLHDELHKTCHPYLDAILAHLQPELERLQNKGYKIFQCSFCKIQALPVLEKENTIYHAKCLVCQHVISGLNAPCISCNSTVYHVGDIANCQKCGYEVYAEEVLNCDVFEMEEEAPFCYCEHDDFLIKQDDEYLCINCFSGFTERDIDECEYCGHKSVDLPRDGSYWLGCNGCDGCDISKD